MSFASDLAEIPQFKRGLVWCRECGREQSVNAVGAVSNGWPKCCGYTMTLDSPEEQKHWANVHSQETDK